MKFKKHTLWLALLACSRAPAKAPEVVSVPEEIRQRYEEATDRLVDEFLDYDRVVSRRDDGSAEHIGDSLIWSGIALYALPCEKGAAIERQLISEIESLNGGVMRHPAQPDSASLDGALGLYYGVADRVYRCPGSRELWAPVIRKHLEFVNDNDRRLNPKSGGKLEPYFEYVLHLLAHRLGVRGKPVDGIRNVLALEVAEWARVVVMSKSACFRVHLGLLTLLTLDRLGEGAPGHIKKIYCRATAPADSPAVDQYCGRKDIKQWIEAYQPDQWEYRHQRCAAWESPDGRVGLRTPGLDYLVALRMGYGL